MRDTHICLHPDQYRRFASGGLDRLQNIRLIAASCRAALIVSFNGPELGISSDIVTMGLPMPWAARISQAALPITA